MTEPARALQRADLEGELEAARHEFHAMLASLSPEDWERRSGNRAWTNGQLLFHIMFGFLLVPRLWRVTQVFDRLPKSWSRAFAALLNFSTPLFNKINAILPRLGARAYGPEALAREFDEVLSGILRRLSSMSDVDWDRGMYYPTRWEPRFSEFMRYKDVARYAVAHLRHHRNQLRISRPG
jgi:uncharacterized damage-inducible protein DinB